MDIEKRRIMLTASIDEYVQRSEVALMFVRRNLEDGGRPFTELDSLRSSVNLLCDHIVMLDELETITRK